jgi:manganese efflux pump family protein
MVASTDLLSIILIAVSLSADCFAVSLSGAVCMARIAYAPVLRTALAFGLAQFLMPVIGWLIGNTLTSLIADYDHWVAFALLAAIGGRMIWESFRPSSAATTAPDISRGLLLLTLALATSIDALAAGLGLAFLKVNIWTAASIIGAAAFILTCLGFLLGCKLGPLFGNRAKTAGGLVLIAIGIRILFSHLSG